MASPAEASSEANCSGISDTRPSEGVQAAADPFLYGSPASAVLDEVSMEFSH